MTVIGINSNRCHVDDPRNKEMELYGHGGRQGHLFDVWFESNEDKLEIMWKEEKNLYDGDWTDFIWEKYHDHKENDGEG